jgi:hypothetical protein
VSYRTTVVLLAVLVILGGVVYYVNQGPAPSATAVTPTPQVVSFVTTDATKLVLTGGSQTTTVSKSGATWDLVQPPLGPADATRVEGWIDQLGNLTADRAITTTADLATYGLTQPKLNVQVDLTGGKTVRLLFGDKTPDGADYYVRVPGDPAKAKSVYLVNAPLGDDLLSALKTPPTAPPTPTPGPTLVPVGTLTLPPVPAATPTAAG